MLSTDVYAGETIHRAALTLVTLANQAGKPVRTDFNGTELVACPRDCPETVVQNWEVARTANRLIRLNSSEGRAIRRQELVEIVREAQAEIAKIDGGEPLPWPYD